METFIKIAQFLLSLSLLIVLHEWGHYFFARLFKTRVNKFYLFGKLLNFKFNDSIKSISEEIILNFDDIIFSNRSDVKEYK